MKSLNSYQDMVQTMKVFIATASDKELAEKKEILSTLVASRDHEMAKAASKCLMLIESEIEDRND